MRSKHVAAVGLLGLAAGAVLMAMCLSAIGASPARTQAHDATLAAVVLLLSCIALGLAGEASARTIRETRRRSATLEQVGEEIVWECDSHGRFTYASAQCLAGLGYPADEVRSLSLFDVLHPNEHAIAHHLLAAGEGWRRRPFHCVAKDGSSVWLRSTAVPTFGAEGRISGLAGASHVMDASPAVEKESSATGAAVLEVIRTGAVRPAFQPIVAFGDLRMVGVEALSRFAVPGSQRSAQDWFTDAAAVGLAVDLELHALRVALEAARELPPDLYVSVNLSPDTLACAELASVLDSFPIAWSRLVIELTEHSSVDDYDLLARALAPLRKEGLRLAVDDAGAGYASFRHILALSADVIKLDRTLISGVDADSARQALAAAVVAFAHDMGAIVVAEGIETPDELRILRDLGVDSAQGYLLGRPTTSAEDWAAWHTPGRAVLTEKAVAAPTG
ncbi:MAG: Diguanylate phosphodiesterase [Blastococcus sp.]|nr:Diguanylate phosphodiesterase [Blastococcus sp.]